VCVWRNIKNDWEYFSNFVSFKVGDGLHIRFWYDVWCGEAAIKFSFPELYSIARDKEASVSDLLDSSYTYIHWNSSFIRHNWIGSWNLDYFLNLLYSLKPNWGGR
jgi:hypothetical protein